MTDAKTIVSGIPVRRVVRFAAVFAVALAAGHLVQTLAARKARPDVAVASLPTKIVELSATPDEVGLTAPLLAPKPDHAVKPLPMKHIFIPVPAKAAPQPAGVTDCAALLVAHGAAGAMVDLALTAACDGGARVVVAHAGMTVTARLSAGGRLAMQLPALDQAGRFQVMFADGRSVAVTQEVPTLAGMQRFAVQWLGADGFVLHGFENGADFGQTGDISPGQPGVVAQGGWLNMLGDAAVDNPLLAQVYTFPANGRTDVVVEAAVTATSCSKDLLGQTISSTQGAAVVTDLTLAMPDCSAIGDFLVLKNLVQDTKLAAK